MKSLDLFINEKLNISKGIIKFPHKLSKLNLSGIPESDSPDYEIGKNQEKFIVDRLNKAYPEYEWITIKDFYGDDYNTRLDLVDGDIIGKNGNKVHFYIDAKVASKKSSSNYLGTITLNSILNFDKDNHYYLCINNDGTKFTTPTSEEIKTIFDTSNDCLCISKNKDRDKFIRKDLDKYLNKYKVKPEHVSTKDFMYSSFYND